MAGRVNVDIYTDASIVKGGRGAWACVVLRGDERHESAGALRGNFPSSTAVEAAAMANALHFARINGLVEGGDLVTMRSDNRGAVGRINGAARNAKCPTIGKAVGYVLDLAERHGIALRAKWVRGHQRLDSADPHAIHNIRCDHLCSAIRDGRKPAGYNALVEQVAGRQRRRERKEQHEAMIGEQESRRLRQAREVGA
jgi:ribonuclease HI